MQVKEEHLITPKMREGTSGRGIQDDEEILILAAVVAGSVAGIGIEMNVILGQHIVSVVDPSALINLIPLYSSQFIQYLYLLRIIEYLSRPPLNITPGV